MTLRTLLAFGTRPEAIKMAPLALALGADPRFEVRVCVTAQHREMLDPVLGLFGIVPDRDLDLMTPDQDLTALTCGVLRGMQGVLAELGPDLVLVQGDTTTAFAAALAAAYARVPVAHVEAGLRTGALGAPPGAPWPEEANRRLVARLAAHHFAPTPRARANLLAEGVDAGTVHVTGNTGIDALRLVAARLDADTAAGAGLRAGIAAQLGGLAADAQGRRLLLVTGHRRESLGGLAAVADALLAAARRHPDLAVAWPLHLNPKVQDPVRRRLGGQPGVHLLPPLDYPAFVHLLGRAHLVLTDSGGVQEEAPALGVPVLVMRAATERPEALQAGTARLVGTDPAAIGAAIDRLLSDPAEHERMSLAHSPFGDGRASQRILEILARHPAARAPAARADAG